MKGQGPDETTGASHPEASSLVDIRTLDRRPTLNEPAGREKFRFWFAGALLVLFAMQVVVPMVVAIFAPDRLDDVEKVAIAALAPTAPLLGAAIGFFFGAQSRR